MAGEDSLPDDAEPSSSPAVAGTDATASDPIRPAASVARAAVPVTGTHVPGDHVLLRRFDPKNEDESTYDEALEVYSLKPAAFAWNSREGDRVGTSVYDDAVLDEHSLHRRLVPQMRWVGIAAAAAATVRALGAAQEVFSPEHEPFPDGSELPVDVAHCEIWRPEPTQNRRALLRALGQQFRSVPLSRIT